jgi:hypothetical protein
MGYIFSQFTGNKYDTAIITFIACFSQDTLLYYFWAENGWFANLAGWGIIKPTFE